jgi:hypothetical protein
MNIASQPLAASPSKVSAGSLLAAAAQHVGGAGIARAEAARVLQPEGARNDHGEGHRAEQVAQGGPDQQGRQGIHRMSAF